MQKKILLVEDSDLDIAVVSDILGKSDFKVEAAKTIEEGYTKAVEFKPDLILLDVMLPDGSGLDLCRRIRKMGGIGERILIVVLTIKNELKDIEAAFNAGADDYMVKPPSPGPLLKKIQLYFRDQK